MAFLVRPRGRCFFPWTRLMSSALVIYGPLGFLAQPGALDYGFGFRVSTTRRRGNGERSGHAEGEAHSDSCWKMRRSRAHLTPDAHSEMACGLRPTPSVLSAAPRVSSLFHPVNGGIL